MASLSELMSALVDSGAQWGRGVQRRASSLAEVLANPSMVANSLQNMPSVQGILSQPAHDQGALSQKALDIGMNFGPGALGSLGGLIGQTVRHGRPINITPTENSFSRINSGDSLGPFVAGETVHNTSSIGASLNAGYVIEPGIQSVPLKYFYEGKRPNLTTGRVDELNRTHALADTIRGSKRMDPLIVAIDDKGPYVLEGGHRLDAAYLLNATHIPAIVVRENGIPRFNDAIPKIIGKE